MVEQAGNYFTTDTFHLVRARTLSLSETETVRYRPKPGKSSRYALHESPVNKTVVTSDLCPWERTPRCRVRRRAGHIRRLRHFVNRSSCHAGCPPPHTQCFGIRAVLSQLPQTQPLMPLGQAHARFIRH